MYNNSFFDTTKGGKVADAIISIADSLKKIANKSEEINKEQIFREVEHQYLLEDAVFQYRDYVFGNEDVSGEDVKKAFSELEDKFGLDVFERLVSEFEKKRDCNISDNDTWHNVIERFLSGNK